jgi:hypothetical protein
MAGSQWSVSIRHNWGINVHIYWGRVFSSPGTVTTISTVGGTNVASAGVIGEYTGNRASFDKSARNTGSSASPSTGTTSTTAVPNELVFGVLGTRGAYSTATTVFSSPTNSFAIVDQANSTINTANADRAVALLVKLLTATGTTSTAATISSARWAGGIASILENRAGFITQ